MQHEKHLDGSGQAIGKTDCRVASLISHHFASGIDKPCSVPRQLTQTKTSTPSLRHPAARGAVLCGRETDAARAANSVKRWVEAVPQLTAVRRASTYLRAMRRREALVYLSRNRCTSAPSLHRRVSDSYADIGISIRRQFQRSSSVRQFIICADIRAACERCT